MALLSPSQLEAGAVVPQSIDNQFVTRELFDEIRSDKLDYHVPTIRDRRSAIAREELIRSLIYAPQVVVNRAFLFNNDLLYDLFSGPSGSLDAFGQLITPSPDSGIQAIVPFLYRESDLTEGVDFTTASAGGKAIRSLLERLGEHPDCVRLHRDDAENATKTSDFGKRFADYFDTLQNFEPEVRMLLMAELLDDTGLADRLYASDDPAYRVEFQRALRHLCQTARRYNDERAAREQDLELDAHLEPLPPLSREYLYRELLLGPHSDRDAVTRGAFDRALDPAVQNFAFEIKKLIDLRYNTNLPDLLDRYSFSPMGFPTRSALHDQHMLGNQTEIDDLDQILQDIRLLTERRIRDDFMERYQKIQHSPFLAELDLSDVVAVRASEPWRRFVGLQAQILDDPIANLAGGLDDLHHAFADLQAVVATRRPSADRGRGACDVLVTAAVSVGGTMVAYGLDDFTWIDDALIAASSTFLPDRLKGVAVKLVYNMVDNTTGRVSRRRSWKFEVARSEEVVARATAQDFFRAAAEAGGRSTDRVAGLAEQERS